MPISTTQFFIQVTLLFTGYQLPSFEKDEVAGRPNKEYIVNTLDKKPQIQAQNLRRKKKDLQLKYLKLLFLQQYACAENTLLLAEGETAMLAGGVMKTFLAYSLLQKCHPALEV